MGSLEGLEGVPAVFLRYPVIDPVLRSHIHLQYI